MAPLSQRAAGISAAADAPTIALTLVAGNRVATFDDHARNGAVMHTTHHSPTRTAYLRALPIPPSILETSKFLLRPLTQELVAKALDRLNKQSSPRKDGFSTHICIALKDNFCHHTFLPVQQ